MDEFDIYRKTYVYIENEVEIDPVQLKVKRHPVNFAKLNGKKNGSNQLKFFFKFTTAQSEMAWLGIDFFQQNKDWSWLHEKTNS